MQDPVDAARHLVHLASSSLTPVPLTNLHLNKLLFYAHGWSLALTNTRLVQHSFEAWQHGPVLKPVYDAFKAYRGAPIGPSEGRASPSIAPGHAWLMQRCITELGPAPGGALIDETHKLHSWMEARHGLASNDRSNKTISDQSIRADFLRMHDLACKQRGLDANAVRVALCDSMEGRVFDLRTLHASLAS